MKIQTASPHKLFPAIVADILRFLVDLLMLP